MRYIATRDINSGKFPQGKPLPADAFSETVIEQLLAIGAIAPDEGEPAPAKPEAASQAAASSPPEPKPLARMNKAELLAEAKIAGAEVAEDATNKAIIEAIEAKRKGAA